MTPHYTPKVHPINLSSMLEKQSFTSFDYELLFKQTGLTQPIIDELHSDPEFKTQVLAFQQDYLKEVTIKNVYLAPTTFCQFVIDPSTKQNKKAFTLAPYHNGYLLFTNATQTLGWRHGHVGLVVDEIRGLTLEALRPGTVSCLQNIHKWEYYPTFKMMRLKNVSMDDLNYISQYALAQLSGLPYNILGAKNQSTLQDTHCSLLIWQAFYHFGYDLDSNGGFFVTPKDLTCSPLLELLQTYGFNPNKDW